MKSIFRSQAFIFGDLPVDRLSPYSFYFLEYLYFMASYNLWTTLHDLIKVDA